MGDISDALKDDFEKFVQPIIEMCVGAVNVQLSYEDPDECDYLISLRSGILDCLVGLFNAISQSKLPQLFQVSWGSVIQPLFNKIATEPPLDKYENEVDIEEMVRKACGLIGDLSRLIPPSKEFLKKTPSIETILGYGNKSQNPSLHKDAVWASSELCK